MTYEVRDGILKHTTGEWSETLEGRVVRIADRVAYINHDMDDAVRAHVLTEADVPVNIRQVLGDRRTTRIDTIVTSLVENSGEEIRMAPDVEQAFTELHDFMYDALYRNPIAKGEESKVSGLLGNMFQYFLAHPDQIPSDLHRVRDTEGVERAVCDYIAGMTDNYAVDVYESLFIPRGWAVKTKPM